jgi:Ser/Thr protein kinase RdoA (MazF antagonist)
MLGATELDELADAFGIGAVQSSRTIAAGTINSNFEVVTDTGRYFLRINEGKAEVDVAWEARVVSALAEAGVVTPSPVAARDGRPYAPLRGAGVRKWVSVFPWREGRHLPADEITQDLAATFGGTLAELQSTIMSTSSHASNVSSAYTIRSSPTPSAFSPRSSRSPATPR